MRATTEAAAASLPDDVVREIFMHVKDVADLFRCAMACKQWHCIILNSSFLRHWRWPDQMSSLLSGFLIWEKLSSTVLTSFITTPRSVFSSDHWFLETFFSRATRARLENAVPLVARRGLLLVRLVLSSNSIVRLAVCNLLAGACDELPPLKCNWDFEKSGYAILTKKADCSSNAKQGYYPALFKVLVIGTDRDHRPHNLHKFTSGEARWSSPSNLFASTTNKRKSEGWLPLRDPRAVVCRGTAHWLICHSTGHDWRLHTIEVDAKTTCSVSLTKIAIPAKHKTTEYYDEPQLIVHAGEKLSLLYLDRQGLRLEIWTRQEEDGSPTTVWLCTAFVELLKPPRQTSMMDLTIVGEKGGILLVKDDNWNVYAAELETGVMVKLTSFENIKRRKVVPLAMDWPTFFVSRLGARKPRSRKPSS